MSDPTTQSEPRYRAEESRLHPGLWWIVDRHTIHSMPPTSFGRSHPDAKAAAEAEVGRLNNGEYGNHNE